MKGKTGIVIAGALLCLGFFFRKSLRLYLHFLPYVFAGPPPSSQCGDGPGFKYCVYDPSPGVSTDQEAVLYFFHYATGDERSWGRIPISRVFYAEFFRRGLPAPRVLSISYGPYWTLFDKGGGRVRSPLASDFLGRDLPWLEHRIGTPKRRYLWGMSQGGLDAALLAFKKPSSWSAVVLSCPALYEIDPFAPKGEIEAYALSHGLHPAKFEWGLELVANRVSGSGAWKAEDPLARAQGRVPAALPPLFVDYNDRDEFGFQNGARAFIEALKKKGREVVARENPGGHCEIDPWSASAFLADQRQRRP